MKTQFDIANELKINFDELHDFIISSDHDYPLAQKSIRKGWMYDDAVAEQIKADYENFHAEEKILKEAAASVMTSNLAGFEGYKITKYAGCICGDAVVQVNRITDTDLEKIVANTLAKTREEALSNLKMKASKLGCNAIVGISFNYVNMPSEKAGQSIGTIQLPQLLCVSASGTAVVVEQL